MSERAPKRDDIYMTTYYFNFHRYYNIAHSTGGANTHSADGEYIHLPITLR